MWPECIASCRSECVLLVRLEVFLLSTLANPPSARPLWNDAETTDGNLVNSGTWPPGRHHHICACHSVYQYRLSCIQNFNFCARNFTLIRGALVPVSCKVQGPEFWCVVSVFLMLVDEQVFDGLDVRPSEADTAEVLRALSRTRNQQEVRFSYY